MKKGRFPNLLVIGAMKAGTTSLHAYLGKHPDIYMSIPKEIHYYSDKNYKDWTKSYYKNFFQTDKKIAGTSPQSYTKCHNKHYQNIPERIYKDTPNVKLIYIVRDPIERYRSDIFESYYCDPISDIEYNFKTKGFVKSSMYAMQLKAYLNYFSLDQIHILSLEDLRSSPLLEMNKIFSFLDLNIMNDDLQFKEVKNASVEKKVPRLVKDLLLFRLFAKVDFSLTYHMARNYTMLFHKSKLQKPQLDQKELKEIKEILEDDIDEFRRITNRDFSNWSI